MRNYQAYPNTSLKRHEHLFQHKTHTKSQVIISFLFLSNSASSCINLSKTDNLYINFLLQKILMRSQEFYPISQSPSISLKNDQGLNKPDDDDPNDKDRNKNGLKYAAIGGGIILLGIGLWKFFTRPSPNPDLNRGGEGARSIKSLTQNDSLEESMTCPISGQIIVDPMTANCGHTFQKARLQEWLTRKSTCPICRMEITVEERPNYMLRDVLNKQNQRTNRRMNRSKSR